MSCVTGVQTCALPIFLNIITLSTLQAVQTELSSCVSALLLGDECCFGEPQGIQRVA